MNNEFQNALIELLKTEPFYAHFVLNSTISFDTHGVPTAGATVQNGSPYLVFNTKFCSKLSIEEYTSIIKHEILHLMFEHTETISKLPDEHQIWNIAMDCAINQYIKNLPEGAINLNSLEKMTSKSLMPFQTSKYYYDNLKSEYDKIKHLQTLDDHSFAEAFEDKSDSGILKRIAIMSAIKEATKASAGNISHDLLKIIENLQDSKLPWTQLLKNFVLTKVKNTTRATRKKINRRFGIKVPGKIKKRTLKLGVCVDSSGSVSDEQFTSFMTEINSIVNQGVEVFLVDADCEVKSTQKIVSKKDFKPKRSGSGGTAYQPAISECVKNKCDVIIYFGDFDSSDAPTNPKVPFLWVGVGSQNPPADFGKVLRIS